MHSRVFVRIYTHRMPVTETHSFLVATDQGGLSGRLGNCLIETAEENPTLQKLRSRIQEIREGKIIKRTSMFEEMLFVMRTCPNPYGLHEDQRFHYRLGSIEMDGLEPKEGAVPILFTQKEEEQSVFDIFNPVTHDLVVFPITQIHPNYERLVGAVASQLGR